MATIHPQTFFRFAAEHHELLKALYEKRDGITETEAMQCIRRFATEGAPGAFYVLDRLRELGFVEPAPHASAQYELSRPFAELMGHLLREYRLTSIEVIRSYFTAMDHMTTELDESVRDENGEAAVRTLQEAADHIERMRSDSRRNREKVVSESMRLKSNREHLPPRQRYAIINRLWTRYLVPLRDMIDTQKAMDASLDGMERVLTEAADCFQRDGAVHMVVESSHARVRRLRRDVMADFRESMREIAPLYEELRRENVLARGASHALERLGRNGMASLSLPERLAISNWRQVGLFSDGSLRAYLLALSDYTPARPAAIGDPVATLRSEHVPIDEFDVAVRRALPIEDALAWLFTTYTDLPLHQLLRLYGRLHTGQLGRTRFAAHAQDYARGAITVTAYPMRLETAA
jgi:hypothetical protein